MKQKYLGFLALGSAFLVLILAARASVTADGTLPVIPGTTERVSLGPGGVEGDNESYFPDISADGRYVAFESLASNFAPNDWNEAFDIFVYDRQAGELEVITQGTPLGDSGYPALSADGRFVAFYSWAGNLVANDTNYYCGYLGNENCADIFVYDRQAETMEMVSVSSAGVQGNNDSFTPAISADGRFVAFASGANNLVGGDWNYQYDIFVHDRQAGTTERVSVDSNGQEANNSSFLPSLSADGRYVAFHSSASNLVPGDTNGDDVFVHDRQTGLTERASVNSAGQQANHNSGYAAISAGGRYVVFASYASNLVTPNDTNWVADFFLRDRWIGVTEKVSVDSNGQGGNDNSGGGDVSADGRYVVFSSGASNLVAGDTSFTVDVFRHDRLTGATEPFSLSWDGQQLGNNASGSPVLTPDGREVVFYSQADNLVITDTSGISDIFIRTRPPISLTLNYPSGAPGSFFTLTGGNFPFSATATIAVNGVPLGSLPTDGSGAFTALLNTAGATPGLYRVAATVLPSREIATLALDPNGVVHPQEGNGPIFLVPPFTFVYLPAIFSPAPP
ncbi:MAG: calcium-binding protein [Chloroflexi bacterium]|nr:calcium-binding protein [Chloroflexota bacterium]MCI0575737.1 calcium-binding protein [Chloroflexota bacterium]MCI0646787.1 calcium-binding protein [Chloroflexota bacterium]MCI0731498.1 calcium-binding protein [Chloroflexota bacterium]